ncbi:hypothetical protein ACHQM5_029095 [Ranunculus cassubicifolius]
MKVFYVATFLVLATLLIYANVSTAVTCSAIQMIPCAGAIATGSPPSPTCCARFKSQQPCLCQYLKDPTISQYVNSPNARKVAIACGVRNPNC